VDGPPLSVFVAPGRVNLIGEHIDYCGGTVLPACIPYHICALVREWDDGHLVMRSREKPYVMEEDLSDMDIPGLEARGRWTDYPLGVLKELLRKDMTAPEARERWAGRIPGLDISFFGDLPDGTGLSSSAAMEAVSCAAFIGTEGFPFAPVTKGMDPRVMMEICHRAENDFVGMPCGTMDQTAVIRGRAGFLTRLDATTGEVEHIPFPSEWIIVAFDTGTRRGLVDTEYATRREQCEEALQEIRVRSGRDIKHLVQGGLDDVHAINDEVVRSRGMHVVTEQARVERMVRALSEGGPDLEPVVGMIMDEGHSSLRDLFEVSCMELDVAQELARGVDGCVGARLTGAGFGGCTVNIVRRGKEDGFVRELCSRYRDVTGKEGRAFVGGPSSGVGRVMVPR